MEVWARWPTKKLLILGLCDYTNIKNYWFEEFHLNACYQWDILLNLCNFMKYNLTTNMKSKGIVPTTAS